MEGDTWEGVAQKPAATFEVINRFNRLHFKIVSLSLSLSLSLPVCTALYQMFCVLF